MPGKLDKVPCLRSLLCSGEQLMRMMKNLGMLVLRMMIRVGKFQEVLEPEKAKISRSPAQAAVAQFLKISSSTSFFLGCLDYHYIQRILQVNYCWGRI